LETKKEVSVSTANNRIVIIGSGPSGLRFIQEVLKRDPLAHITVFNNEPFQPYNRVQLSALLANDVDFNEIFQTLPDQYTYPNFKHVICKITSIDTENKELTDAQGTKHTYQKLVIATGSRAHIPNIPGVESTGVYTFRNLKDTQALFARLASAKHVVVAGGGLLGIEAAKALLQSNTKVTLIQQGPHLMNRQLDAKASEMLKSELEALGISVIVNTGLKSIISNDRVTSVNTRADENIVCDTVLICAGITHNTELARAAKLDVATGILVDDQLKTSAEDVYAIGECCEFNGETFGLVSPCYEQAAIAADVITGGESTYKGSTPISRLKVVGKQVCSMGEVADLAYHPRQQVLSFSNDELGIYRKVVLLKGKIIGALAIGDWPEIRRVEEAYKSQHKIGFSQAMLFRLKGQLWWNDEANNVASWSSNTLVCQCNAISQGACMQAIAAGCTTVESLSQNTTAGTVCGSCKPLLEQLVESSTGQAKAWLPALVMSALALLVISLITMLPALSVSDTVQQPSLLESWWNDKYWKQVSGFTLLGLTAVGLVMSLRKRIKLSFFQRLGSFTNWRLLHICLGVVCTFVLILHTGMHLGQNLNQMLMINFLLVILLGSLAGAVMSLSHTFSASSAQKVRDFWNFMHILVTWPLPVLLALHIFTVYYY